MFVTEEVSMLTLILLSFLSKGERGPPGINGTQGFQGCPGERGMKVKEENWALQKKNTYCIDFSIDTNPVYTSSLLSHCSI